MVVSEGREIGRSVFGNQDRKRAIRSDIRTPEEHYMTLSKLILNVTFYVGNIPLPLTLYNYLNNHLAVFRISPI